METNKDVPTSTERRPQLLNITQNSARPDVTGQLRVMDDLDCIEGGDSWCLEDIYKRDPTIEVLALKMLLVRKDKEYEEMKKCKEGLQKKLNELDVLLQRYESLDGKRTPSNIRDDPSPINSLNRERNFIGELQKFDEEIEKADHQVTRIHQFEQNEVVEQLLISNDDLSKECQQLEKKFKESENALVILEDQLESLRSAKLRETERTNSLACELALTQAKALHLEQLAHAEVGRMMSGSSSSFRSGSIRQHSSPIHESIKENKTDIPVLRPTIVKVHSCVDEVSPPRVTQKGSPEKTKVKPTDDFNLRSNSSSEDRCNYLSPNVVIKQKVNFDLEDSICGDVKNSVKFSDMDDDDLCQYQLMLLEARDNENDKMDMNPEELEAQIDELNFYMSGQSRKIPEPNPCFVRFSVNGWGATLAKVRSYFLNFRGVTGVKVVGAAVFITFNTPKDAQVVVDKNPHVVGGCHLIPGPVVMMEADNGFMRSEVGATGVMVAFDELYDAAGTMAVFDELAEEIDPFMARTVEFFKSGEVLDTKLLTSIPGVESISTDGNTVRLTYTEKNVCEEVLDEGYVMVGDDQKVVGRIGQLGKVEIEVTGGKGMLEPAELLDLLEAAGMTPVLDIQTKGGRLFGIVMENAKCKELVKKRKLPLKDGLMARVVEGAKQFHGDLGKGEELAGKMMQPFEEIVIRKPFGEYVNNRRNMDIGGLGYGYIPTDPRKDVNDNIIDPPIFTSNIKNGEKIEYFQTDLQKVTNKNFARHNEILKHKTTEKECQRSVEDEKCTLERKLKIGAVKGEGKGNEFEPDKMEETVQEVSRSLGDSGSENSNVNFDEDCVPNPEEKKEFQIEVVKMLPIPRKSKEKSMEKSADIFQNTGAKSIRSLNDTTDDDDDSEEEEMYHGRNNDSIQVVRMTLAPSRSAQK